MWAVFPYGTSLNDKFFFLGIFEYRFPDLKKMPDQLIEKNKYYTS